MIYKVQKPIHPPPPTGEILAYTKDRKSQILLPWSAMWAVLFETYGLQAWGKFNFFAEAHVEGTTLVIDKVLKEDLGW